MRDKVLRGINFGISFGVYLILGVWCGVYASELDDRFGAFSIVISLAPIMIHFILHIIVHEAGHLVAGLMSGYEFASFRIGSLIWVKGRDGKLHLKK